jgi:hypothetical protein
MTYAMSTRPPTNADPPPDELPQRGLLNKWLVASMVVACLAGGAAIVSYELLRTKPSSARDAGKAEPTAAVNPIAKSESATDDRNLIDDDGRTMWASPTSGPPLDLAYLPPGSQIILALRPADLAKHGEGAKVLASLGPLGARGIEYVEGVTRLPWAEIERLLISCQATSAGQWQIALVAYVNEPLTRQQMLERLPDATTKRHARGEYWLAGERAYFMPHDRAGKVLVVTPAELIGDVLALDGTPPPLRRDIERLLASTDADRDVTLIVAPNFLFGDGQSVFGGEMARLREPLFWFLGDSLNAAALSIHWGEHFFLELVAMPTLDTQPGQAARQLAERVAQIPDLIEDYAGRLDPVPYAQRIVARFPTMMRKLAAYTRSGVEGDHALLRSYLPAQAGHNLLLGAELTLAEAPGSKGPVTDLGELSRVEATSPLAGEASVGELLRRPTSLQFARDSLEVAFEQLSQDIGVEIIILGPDLQADGITRNQQLAIDMQDRPAEEILVKILRAANPDKSATGPADPRQKLVYVVKPKSPGGPEAVFITTRARAAERGDALPAAFENSTSE